MFTFRSQVPFIFFIFYLALNLTSCSNEGLSSFSSLGSPSIINAVSLSPKYLI